MDCLNIYDIQILQVIFPGVRPFFAMVYLYVKKPFPPLIEKWSWITQTHAMPARHLFIWQRDSGRDTGMYRSSVGHRRKHCQKNEDGITVLQEAAKSACYKLLEAALTHSITQSEKLSQRQRMLFSFPPQQAYRKAP